MTHGNRTIALAFFALGLSVALMIAGVSDHNKRVACQGTANAGDRP